MSDILKKLYDERILHVAARPEGGLLLTEACDEHFELALTREEVRELAAKLIEMSESAL